jgi:hypothetical protein
MVRTVSLLAVVSLGLLASAVMTSVKRTVEEVESCIKDIGFDITRMGDAVANFKASSTAEKARVCSLFSREPWSWGIWLTF